MKIIFSLQLFFILPFFSLSQKIEWGDFSPYKGNTIDIIQNKNTFYTLRNRKNFIFNNTYLSNFTDFDQVYCEKLKNKIGNKSANIIGFEIIDEQPIIILVDDYQSKNIIYLQKLNSKGLPAGPVTEIMQYQIPNNWFNKGIYNFEIANNKKFIFCYYLIEYEKGKRSEIGYKVIDDEFKLLNQGVLNFEHDSESIYDYNFKISNSGQLFLLKKIKKNNSKTFFSSYNESFNIELHEIKNDSLKSIPINLNKLNLTDIKIECNNNQLSIAGLYSNEESNVKVLGTYFLNYSLINKKIINEGKTSFDPDFIIQNWSERAKKRALEMVTKGKEAPALYDYYLKGLIPMKDSSVIFLLEQYYINSFNYTDPRTGFITTRYIYHYNDIIVGKILNDNKISWMKMIPKNQTSENDGGYYSSFSYFKSENQLKLYFNDAATNYDKSGIYKEKSEFVLFSKLRKILATVEIDLNTGELKRFDSKYITSRFEFTIPRIFANNINTNTFILFIRKGKKEKFGIIKY